MGAKRKRLELPEIAIMSVRDFPSAVDLDWVVKFSRTAPSDLSGWRKLLLFGLPVVPSVCVGGFDLSAKIRFEKRFVGHVG